MRGPLWDDSITFRAAQESAANMEQDRWREKFIKEFGQDAYHFLKGISDSSVVDAEVVDGDTRENL